MVKCCPSAEQLCIADTHPVVKERGDIQLGSRTRHMQHQAVTAVIHLQTIHDEAARQTHSDPSHIHTSSHALRKHVGCEARQPSLDRRNGRDSQQQQIASEHDEHAEAKQVFECFDEP